MVSKKRNALKVYAGFMLQSHISRYSNICADFRNQVSFTTDICYVIKGALDSLVR